MNDQMMCECGLAWDVADDDPPACPSDEVLAPAVQALHKMADDWQRMQPVKCDGYSTDEDDDQ